jgi:quercetin dioxygenase-like cupin family protein
LHSHPDYAIYTTSGGTATFYGKDGSSMKNEMKTGSVNIRGGEIHSVKNTGKTTIKVILVEVNRPAQTTSQDAALDATKVASAMYKLRKDTLGIRVIEINYKAGQASAMHSHPDDALYVIQGGKAEFTGKDGTKRTVDLKSGLAMVGPADTHSVKNPGKTPFKAILVEVNRAR